MLGSSSLYMLAPHKFKNTCILSAILSGNIALVFFFSISSAFLRRAYVHDNGDMFTKKLTAI